MREHNSEADELASDAAGKPTLLKPVSACLKKFVCVCFDGSYKPGAHPRAGAGYIVKHSDVASPLGSAEWQPYAWGSLALEPVSSAYSELCAVLATEILLENLMFDTAWPFEAGQRPVTVHALTHIFCMT